MLGGSPATILAPRRVTGLLAWGSSAWRDWRRRARPTPAATPWSTRAVVERPEQTLGSGPHPDATRECRRLDVDAAAPARPWRSRRASRAALRGRVLRSSAAGRFAPSSDGRSRSSAPRSTASSSRGVWRCARTGARPAGRLGLPDELPFCRDALRSPATRRAGGARNRTHDDGSAGRSMTPDGRPAHAWSRQSTRYYALHCPGSGSTGSPSPRATVRRWLPTAGERPVVGSSLSVGAATDIPLTHADKPSGFGFAQPLPLPVTPSRVLSQPPLAPLPRLPRSTPYVVARGTAPSLAARVLCRARCPGVDDRRSSRGCSLSAVKAGEPDSPRTRLDARSDGHKSRSVIFRRSVCTAGRPHTIYHATERSTVPRQAQIARDRCSLRVVWQLIQAGVVHGRMPRARPRGHPGRLLITRRSTVPLLRRQPATRGRAEAALRRELRAHYRRENAAAVLSTVWGRPVRTVAAEVAAKRRRIAPWTQPSSRDIRGFMLSRSRRTISPALATATPPRSQTQTTAVL